MPRAGPRAKPPPAPPFDLVELRAPEFTAGRHAWRWTGPAPRTRSRRAARCAVRRLPAASRHCRRSRRRATRDTGGRIAGRRTGAAEWSARSGEGATHVTRSPTAPTRDAATRTRCRDSDGMPRLGRDAATRTGCRDSDGMPRLGRDTAPPPQGAVTWCGAGGGRAAIWRG